MVLPVPSYSANLSASINRKILKLSNRYSFTSLGIRIRSFFINWVYHSSIPALFIFMALLAVYLGQVRAKRL